MERQPARVLEPADVRRLLRLVEHQRHAYRNRVIVLLSFKACWNAAPIAPGGYSSMALLRLNMKACSTVP